MKKIKLLHIAFAGGGVDIAIRLINTNLHAQRFDLSVLREAEHNEYYDKVGEVISSQILLVDRSIGFSDLKNIIKLLSIVKTMSPDVLHLHSAKAGILGRIVGRIHRIPSFYTPHAFSFLSAKKWYARKFYIFIEKFVKIISYKSKIIACSVSEYNRAINEIGFKDSDVELYSNSIPIINKSKLNLPKEFDLTPGYLCTIGRPSYQKNLLKMIEVLQELHNQGLKKHLVILGVGYYSPDLDAVNELVREIGLSEYVVLYPWVERNQGLAILKNASIYISTALYEGLPLSVIEAMALGVPSVLSNVDGNKDLIKNGENGFLVDDFDVYKFIEYIIKLTTNKAIYKKFSKCVEKEFYENFDSRKNISRLENIYNSYGSKNVIGV